MNKEKLLNNFRKKSEKWLNWFPTILISIILSTSCLLFFPIGPAIFMLLGGNVNIGGWIQFIILLIVWARFLEQLEKDFNTCEK